MGAARLGADDPDELLPLAGFSAGNLAIFAVFGSLFAEVYFFSRLLQNAWATTPSKRACG